MANLIINETNRKTAQHDFFSSGVNGERLFSIREGVPVDDAVNSASAMLAAAHETIKRIAEKHDDEELWGASYLLQMAAATMQAAACGLIAESHSDQPS